MMDDLINRQEILKHIEKTRQDALMIDDIRESNIIMRGMNLLEEAVRNQPSAQPEQCEFCKNRGLEDGDTLYISADWDGGIGFDFIRDIHYCPKCGRRL